MMLKPTVSAISIIDSEKVSNPVFQQFETAGTRINSLAVVVENIGYQNVITSIAHDYTDRSPSTTSKNPMTYRKSRNFNKSNLMKGYNSLVPTTNQYSE